MKAVNKGIRKLDAMALVTGKPVFTDDIAPDNCLVVRILRSPHAFARIRQIDTAAARALPGIETVLTWRDVPPHRFTLAGQSYPEPSPYDRLILDRLVRYVGDPVAIVAGTSEKQVNSALKAISVDYEVFTPVIDPEQALDHPSVIHPEEDYHVNSDIGNDVQRNLCCQGEFVSGSVDTQFSRCHTVVERTYHTKANSQAMMETFRTYTYLDQAGRLTMVTSTQIPFHVRRIAARALGLSPSRIRVVKPRIGGGFGAKQTMVSELFPALVTMKTGKPAKIIFSRQESFSASNSRHEMIIKVKIGADKDGRIRAIHMHTLSNAGAYGEHAPTTAGLTGHKTLGLYNRADAFKFTWQVVYTNTMAAGAFRGYGATQGTFAMESTVNELADILGMDPIALRMKNLVKQGDIVPAYYNEPINSCSLEACMKKGRNMIGWDQKFPSYRISNTRIGAVGMAVAMQGSGISGIDTASVQVRLQDDAYYTLMIGATDMGTGCDTILAQMAAESLMCGMDRIIVSPVDTDHSPFDTGSYASSTTYVTGSAVVRACTRLKEKIIDQAAALMNADSGSLIFDGSRIFSPDKEISLESLARALVVGDHVTLSADASHCSPISPPPFMAGFADIELDLETGQVHLRDYVGVVDCGTPINPNLARVQAEGGIVQGIGMALFEDITYNAKGKMTNNSFMLYKIPTRLDIGTIRVDFETSHEPTGPFGAKSIGEVVINTPAPAIAHAVHNASGRYYRTLPITGEAVFKALWKG